MTEHKPFDFTALEPLDDFRAVTDTAHYVPLPDDWRVVVVDIKGSTKAIEAGRYKDVNILGASAIIAALNAIGDEEIPYVFGGDGATFALPPHLVESVGIALHGTRRMAEEAFDMELRAGMVSMRDIRKNGADMLVTRLRISPGLTLAMFAGGGAETADRLVKDPEGGAAYDVTTLLDEAALAKAEPDFSGLHCRWNPIRNRNGETVTLMVMARGDNAQARAQVYGDVMRAFEDIFGELDNYRPVTAPQMKFGGGRNIIGGDAAVRSWGKKGIARAFEPWKLRLITLCGQLMFKTGIGIADFRPEKYMRRLPVNSDFRKFDDTLRMIVDARPEQRAALADALDKMHADGRVFYGMNISDTALMTCLVFDYDERHLHFIDGGDGGYAMAARQMKAQMAADASGEAQRKEATR